MAINVLNSRHRDRLREDVQIARRSLERYRDVRNQLVRDYAGDLWESDAAGMRKRNPRRVVLDLMYQAVSQYAMQLSTKRPRARVTSEYPELRGFASGFEVTLNGLAARQRIETVIQEVVLEACFSMGIARVGMLPTGGGPFGDPGMPGIENISFDDWFHDTRAKTDDRMRFMGHSYECHMDLLRSDDNLDQSKVRLLKPGRRPGNDIVESDPVKDIEAGQEWDDYDSIVVLCDVWLPYEQKLLTTDHRFGHVLEVKDWDGPWHGPYHLLRFMRVPDSIMGLPGAYGLKSMFDLINIIWRKLGRQAKNQKRVNMVRQGADEVANALTHSNDGEVVRGKPDDLTGWSSLGVDPMLAQFGVQVQDQFNRASGNYEQMAGLGPSADTLGQEQIIQANVSARLAKMQSEVANFSQSAFKALGWHLWTDSVYSSVDNLPLYDADLGETIPVPIEWLPEQREGDYWQYNFDIAPYSMSYSSPAEQARDLTQVLSGVIMPAMPFLREQGLTVDFNATLEAISRLRDVPELREILVAQAPPSNEQNGPNTSDGAGKSPVTSRNYTRTSVSTGGTPQGRRNAMAAQFSGQATPQQSQMVSTPT